MRIAKLEIVRNTYNFGTQIQGRHVQPGDVVGQVALKGDDGAEIVLPLTEAQIAAALAAVAPSAAGAMRDLGAAVHAGMFSPRPALEHAPSVDDFVEAPAGWQRADTSTEASLPVDVQRHPIAVGQTWKMRNGDTALVEEIDDDDTHPVWAACSDGHGRSFSPEGRWCPDVTEDSPYDLLELVEGPAKEAPAEEAPAEEAPAPKPEILVGQVWENRYGDKVEILELSDDAGAAYQVRGRYTGNRAPDGAKLDDEAFWTREGVWLEGQDSGLDLVKLVRVLGEGAQDPIPCAG